MERLNTQENKKVQIYILECLKKICTEEKLDYYLIGGTLIGSIRHQGFIPWDDDIDVAMPLMDYLKLKKIILYNYAEEFELLDFLDNDNYILNFGKLGLKGTYFKPSGYKFLNSNKISIDLFPLFSTKKQHILVKLKYIFYRITFKLLLLNHKLFNKTPGYIKKILIIKITVKSINKSMKTLFKIIYNKFYLRESSGDFYSNLFPKSFRQIKREIFHKSFFEPHKLMQFEKSYYKVPGLYHLYLEKIFGNYLILPNKDDRVGHGLNESYIINDFLFDRVGLK